MTENRTDRTTNLGLLALMQSPSGGGPSSGTQGWGFPYWNQLWLDALIAALHDAARTGEALLTAPATGPTVELSSTTGYLPAGLTLEVCQTWVDEWGRETDAGTVSEVSTGEAIPDPDTAPALGTPTPAAAGFDGGLLEVAYSWIDEAAGETISSPVASVSVPYRTGGLQSEVLVTLPATPLSVGAAGAYVYARHRSGNWVRAAAITDDTEDEATLDGTWISCFVALPLANSTGAGRAIDITGIEAPAAAALTRIYVRLKSTEWYATDARLCLSSVDEWDPSAVSYPLVYTGAVGELAPGYPPPVTQVKALRQIDLGSEVDGVLDESQIDEAIARAEDVGEHVDDEDVHFTGTEKASCLLSAEEKDELTGGQETDLHSHAGAGMTAASTEETNAGTSTSKAVTPDGLAGSYAGTKSLLLIVIEAATDVSQGEGKMYVPIPPALNGMNLVSANAIVNTAGTTNATTVDIYNVTDSQDMLSTAISIASGDTVGTAGTVNASYDDVATNDVLRVDVTTVSTTKPKGLMIMLEFRLP